MGRWWPSGTWWRCFLRSTHGQACTHVSYTQLWGLLHSRTRCRPNSHPFPMQWGVGLTSTFSTTCFPKEHTLVETVMVMFSALLYWLLTP